MNNYSRRNFNFTHFLTIPVTGRAKSRNICQTSNKPRSISNEAISLHFTKTQSSIPYDKKQQNDKELTIDQLELKQMVYHFCEHLSILSMYLYKKPQKSDVLSISPGMLRIMASNDARIFIRNPRKAKY